MRDRGTKDAIDDPEATELDISGWNAYQQPDKKTKVKGDAKAASTQIATADAVAIRAFSAGDGKSVERKIYGDGLVKFEKIPPGNYFLVETDKPDGWAPMFDVYRLYVDGSGWISISAVETGKDGKHTWPDATDPTQPADGPTTAFAKDADGKYSLSQTISENAETVDVFTIMNVSTLSRNVILRKVASGEQYKSIPEAVFTVYCADGQTPVRLLDDDGKVLTFKDVTGKEHTELSELPSASSGIFWAGRLPYGKYYLLETTVPSGYQKETEDGNWFILTVSEDGVGYEQATGAIQNTIEPEASKP